MKKHFVLLARSYVAGGVTIAGIEMVGEYVVKKKDGRPKWIRPMTAEGDVVISWKSVSHLALLDIVEIEMTKAIPQRYQSENVLFDGGPIEKIGRYEGRIDSLCEHTESSLFGNQGKAIHYSNIDDLTHSFKLIHVERYAVSKDVKPRMVFYYRGTSYDLAITDRHFVNSYKEAPSLAPKDKSIYLAISVGPLDGEFHTKMVAGVVIPSFS